jgi:alkaline phosphatase
VQSLRTFNKIITLPVLFFLCAAAAPVRDKVSFGRQAVPDSDSLKAPKNIILLIGDGMGLAQISAGMYWIGVGKTAFERFPVVGFHKSHSCNDLVTDSAAGATAFSCGQKTTNGAVGVLPPKNKPCQTILEDLEEQGYASGMVVSCSASHATPASFIAHRELRAFSEEIAADYLKTPLDCFIGGGHHFFYDRPDGRNLEDSLKKRGYVVRTGTSMRKLPWDGSAPFMLFTADYEPPTASGGRTYMPEATRRTCEYLKRRSQKGFFLMVEGSQIDWGGHSNDRNWVRAEMEDFNKVLEEALKFAAADGETLVIVTGDHECGGLALADIKSKKAFQAKFTTRLHTASLVPVLAYGPRSELFFGIYDNTAIYAKMREALGRKE